MAMPRWLPFRYAGGLSLVVLLLLAIAGAIFLPPQPVRDPSAEPSRARPPGTDEVDAWLLDHPGGGVIRCTWPVDLPRGGKIADAPGVWLDPGLVQAVPTQVGGAPVLGADGAPQAWVGWSGELCTVYSPTRVSVRGSVVDARGEPAPSTVIGCGERVATGSDGHFELELGPSALLHAEQSLSGPRCPLRVSADGPATPIALHRAGTVRVVVQAGG